MVPVGTALTSVWYHLVPMSRAKKSSDEATVRDRILTAAFEAFQARGYAATSTLEIATRAHVSKRELYALVGNKQQMLIAAIGERATRLQAPAEMPKLRDRPTLAQVLTAFGSQFVREVSDPDVVAVFRLAIAEAIQAPEVARFLMGRDYKPKRAKPLVGRVAQFNDILHHLYPWLYRV